MEKQTIIIQYVGEKPSNGAIIAAFSVLLNNGMVVDSNVEPTIHHLTEKEVMSAASVLASKTSGKGVTVKVETPRKNVILTEAKKAKILETLAEVFNG